MQPLPHIYSVTAAGADTGVVGLSAHGVPSIRSAAPAEFGGPSDQWSPESLLAGALASCFVLSFRSVARASHVRWLRLDCDVEAILDRTEGIVRFIKVVVHAKLLVPVGTDTALCERVLRKAEHGCLVANSLRCERELQMELVTVPIAEPANVLA